MKTALTYAEASAQLKQVGTSNAKGAALRAMYAQLVANAHGGKPAVYFGCIAGETDAEVTAKAKKLLSSREAAWDALMGIAA